MSVMKNEILVFKSSVEDKENGNDPYLSTLRKAMFTAKLIPVMDFEYVQLMTLHSKLLNPDSYSGLIFTSPRAVMAAKLSLESAKLPQQWNNLPIFVVGGGTAHAVKQELNLKSEGSLSGSASSLADYIMQKSYEKPLLFPCGQMKRDILPTELEKGGVDLDIITVYESIPHPNLKQNIDDAFQNGKCVPEFLVYFSPSGVKFTLPILQSMQIPVKDIKLISIGPTTATCLKESQLTVWSVAVKPSPECLLEAITSKGMKMILRNNTT